MKIKIKKEIYKCTKTYKWNNVKYNMINFLVKYFYMDLKIMEKLNENVQKNKY